MRIKLFLLNTCVFFIVATNLFSISHKEILNALKDELKRSMDSLKLEDLPQPYYIDYTLTLTNSYNVRATLGNIIDTNSSFRAQITVNVRVGDYSFDNSNFLDLSFSFLFFGEMDEFSASRSIPKEFDYWMLRRELWLATDAAFRQATQTYTKKLSAMKYRVLKDTLPDFSRETPHKYIDTNFSFPKIDFITIVNDIKRTSSIFANYPEINNSLATFEHIQEVKYFANSEGFEFVKPEAFTGIEISGTSRAVDGMIVNDFIHFYGLLPDELPTVDSLLRATNLLCEKIINLQQAPVLEESYSGPILFESQAACELFAQVFAPNLVAQRPLLSEQGLQNFSRFTAFQTKIGGRVLPEFLTVLSLPTLKKYQNFPLIGYYPVDDQGVPAKNLTLVENGYLKTLLTDRTPVKRVLNSNGNSRDGSPMFSNLVVESKKNYEKSNKELKNKLIQLCQKRGLPYCIVVRKIMNQNILSTVFYDLSPIDYKFSSSQSTIPVIEAYKVYPDGREELIRGCELKGITPQSFKDIIFVGKNSNLLHILAPIIQSGFGRSGYVQASIVVPNLLFEDAELKNIEMDFQKPPKLVSPLFERNE